MLCRVCFGSLSLESSEEFSAAERFLPLFAREETRVGCVEGEGVCFGGMVVAVKLCIARRVLVDESQIEPAKTLIEETGDARITLDAEGEKWLQRELGSRGAR